MASKQEQIFEPTFEEKKNCGKALKAGPQIVSLTPISSASPRPASPLVLQGVS